MHKWLPLTALLLASGGPSLPVYGVGLLGPDGKTVACNVYADGGVVASNCKFSGVAGVDGGVGPAGPAGYGWAP